VKAIVVHVRLCEEITLIIEIHKYMTQKTVDSYDLLVVTLGSPLMHDWHPVLNYSLLSCFLVSNSQVSIAECLKVDRTIVKFNCISPTYILTGRGTLFTSKDWHLKCRISNKSVNKREEMIFLNFFLVLLKSRPWMATHLAYCRPILFEMEAFLGIRSAL
jgi:hypothetical protein